MTQDLDAPIATTADAMPQILIGQIDDFNPSPRNARTHSEEQIAFLAELFVQFGWTYPVLRDQAGAVFAGHGRLKAARKLYNAGKLIKMANGFVLPFGGVPWFDCSNWSDDQKRAYMLADNEIALLSAWDQGLKDSELALLAEKVPILQALFGDDDKVLSADEGSSDALHMPDVAAVQDTFWFTLSGPIDKQAKALLMVRQLLGAWPELTLEQGVMRHG